MLNLEELRKWRFAHDRYLVKKYLSEGGKITRCPPGEAWIPMTLPSDRHTVFNTGRKQQTMKAWGYRARH